MPTPSTDVIINMNVLLTENVVYQATMKTDDGLNMILLRFIEPGNRFYNNRRSFYKGCNVNSLTLSKGLQREIP